MSRHQLQVRRIPFRFDEGIDPVWNAARPEWSHMVNGASLVMPYLEPFLIRTMNEALQRTDDPKLIEDVKGFNGQEGAHYRNHRRYNDILKLRYPELAGVEALMELDYKRFAGRSLKWRLAYAAGFETMTMGVTEWIISKREALFAGADPSVTSLVLWHMVEETEHKNVAYDLYMHLFGKDWRAKQIGLIAGSCHVAWMSRKAYKRMLQRDGRWGRWRSRLALYAMVARFLVNVSPAMLRALLPGYHPGKVKDPEWVTQWADAYDGLDDGEIPLLDTRDADIPARFAARHP